MDWKPAARQLAASTAIRPESRWYEPVATTPRHEFVPHWWARKTSDREGPVWVRREGAADPEVWMRSAYADTTLVTRVSNHHADLADTATTLPRSREQRSTSSSTLPSLILTMYREAWIQDSSRLLVTCGSGYGTALACARVGEEQVTSVDVDAYLVESARARLAEAGHQPRLEVCDLTGDLPDGGYDRIISTVALPAVPVSWLQALAPGGRLVTSIASTGLVIVADRTPEGGAVGKVAPQAAGFMSVRHGEDYDDTFPEDLQLWQTAQHEEGDVTTSRFPLMYVPDTWDVRSTLELLVPGIDHRQHHGPDGSRTLYMLHADGSWARATAPDHRTSPTVHQGGPRRLWDELDRVRTWLAIDGDLPVRGADVDITPEGVTTLSRRGWSATIA
ncbi:methyltransferase domain-containing protein [Streptomyces griseus]|uniref:methyltransferase domain-containing protein n=1 Tax=Streptomyces griseus TaxID=1911 RepID=UPI0037AAA0D2